MPGFLVLTANPDASLKRGVVLVAHMREGPY
jgi:hypothetical protein